MLSDPVDYLMMLVALAPLIMLVMLLRAPKSKKRLVLLVVSVVVFIVLAPLTGLYLALPLRTLTPWFESPEALEWLGPIFIIGSACFVIAIVAYIVRHMRSRKKNS